MAARRDAAFVPPDDATGGVAIVTVAGGSITDAELRASPVPVSGTVAVSGTVPVSGPLTDAQLRAAAVPVSVASIPTHAVTQSGAWTVGHGKTLKSATGSASAAGDNTLVAAVVGAKIKVFAFSLTLISSAAELTAKFQSDATDLWGVAIQTPASVSAGANLAVPPPAHLFETAVFTALQLNLSAAVAVRWSVAYFEEA